MVTKVEMFVLAVIAAVLLGLGVFAHHEKRLAERLQVELALAQAASETCSASIAELEAQAKEREQAAAKALAEAQAAADKYALRADRILKTPAAVAGDDCASAQVRARAWLEGRQ